MKMHFPVTPFACLVLIAFLYSPAVALAETRVLDGSVAYRERIALPPDASVEVKLVDVSLADAAAQTIAETTISPAGQVPVPYRLEFDDAGIVAGRSYALQARITAGGRLLFITATRHPIFTGVNDNTDITVERVTGTASPAGRWLAEDIRGAGVIDRAQTVLEIAENGTISGTGGCNRMSGRAEISGSDIVIGPVAATKMACTPALMHQEGRFFSALAEVRKWQVDQARGKLSLLDGDGNVLVILARQ